MRLRALALLLCCLGAAGAPGVLAAEKAVPEPSGLRLDLAAGTLPPLAERLPAAPRRDLPARKDWQEGRYGGRLTILTANGNDAPDQAGFLLRFGGARLVAWDEAQNLVPDILESVEVAGDRIFTLALRPGHRWSDGAPFTSEDIRFWWQDVAGNTDLSPYGLPRALLAGGKPPEVEILDETHVRFTWPAPNARFLPALAAAEPLLIYRPAHYLKKFHAGYADSDALAKAAAAIGLTSWAELFHRKDRALAFDNPERPTLQPWMTTTAPPAARFVARRNPYFHRVDAQGRQLPYIDEIVLVPTAAEEIAAKTAAGESDLQVAGLSFSDGAALKQAEKDGKVKLRLWPGGQGSQLALYPNLNAASPGWRMVLRDVRFRRALSLGLDRAALNQALYQGAALPGADTLLPASPLYAEADRKAWAGYDMQQANALLDELGMTWKDSDGIRHLPDGRRAELVVESAGADPTEAETLDLVKAQWAKIGIALVARRQPAEVLRQRIEAGVTVMSLAPGLANGLATAALSPAALAPTSRGQHNWPFWGLHYQSGGDAGEPPALPAARRLLALYEDWTQAGDEDQRAAAWREMLQIHAAQVFTIGLVGALPQPVAASPRLRNLPAEAAWRDGPGAGFGRIRPDTFWLAKK